MFNSRQIKDIIRKNGLSINKKMGQNFLVVESVRDEIIGYCDISNEDSILEIGPGLGVLTEAIYPLCKELIIVEKDKGFSVLLKDVFKDCKNIEIINADILKIDISRLYERVKKKIRVIGNLPYYITSPILFYLLENKNYLDSIYVTIQKEVAQRIVAAPGIKDYGILSCQMQYHFTPKVLMHIPKGCFFPLPEVDSALIELAIPKSPTVEVEDESLFFSIIRAAFNQRRKTLFNALSQSPFIKIDKFRLKKAFESAGITFNIRGETLSLQDFSRLASLLKD
jgi:16S rRNA (adenine1518-N6/adenine1519-N6)-dimethyltransferase